MPNNGRQEEEAARIARQERAAEIVAHTSVALAFVDELCVALEARASEAGEAGEEASQRARILCREIRAQVGGAAQAARELAREAPSRVTYQITEAGRDAIRRPARAEQAAAFLESIAAALEADTRHAGSRLAFALEAEADRLRAEGAELGALEVASQASTITAAGKGLAACIENVRNEARRREAGPEGTG